MVGGTRSRARNEDVKSPTSPSDDGTIANTTTSAAAGPSGREKPPIRPQSSVIHARDEVSRLSEGLEPISLVDREGKYPNSHLRAGF